MAGVCTRHVAVKDAVLEPARLCSQSGHQYVFLPKTVSFRQTTCQIWALILSSLGREY